MANSSINIFFLTPTQQKKQPDRNVKRPLIQALKTKKEDNNDDRIVNKLSNIIKELSALPHTMHAGGG